MTDPFAPFRRWLEWLDSHDGRLHRRSGGQEETDHDLACLLPGPPGRTLFTVGDLRALVAAGREWAAARQGVGGVSPAPPRAECPGHDRGGTAPPCCGRAGEYNGFGSGPLLFLCPNSCSCHD